MSRMLSRLMLRGRRGPEQSGRAVPPPPAPSELSEPGKPGESGEPEILDRPDLPFTAVEEALRGLGRINRLLLGFGPFVRTLLPRLAAGSGRVRLLDVGTGAGQPAALLARRARRRGVEATVVGLDRKLSHLVVGRRAGCEQLRVVGSAEALPFRGGAFDWSCSTLLFHHLDDAAKRAVLAEMRRVSRRGAAVVDLRRSRVAYALARLLIPLLAGGPVNRHDGPLSVLRSSTVREVAELCRDLPVAELRRRFPFRFSLVVAGEPAPPRG